MSSLYIHVLLFHLIVSIVGKRSDPSEHEAATGQGVYRGEKSHLRDCRGGANQRPSDPLRPPIQRSQSEATMTPRSQSKFCRSFSEQRSRPSPLKSGTVCDLTHTKENYLLYFEDKG